MGNFADVVASFDPHRTAFGAILADLGVSSHQIDSADRGFSFREGAPLDMRMSSSGLTASEFLGTAGENELARTFREYGDERRAARLAREIVRRRQTQQFDTSDALVGAIRGALGPRAGPSDFARLFQAVRIAVNEELESLQRALPVLRDLLEPNGILAVIAYHSGEDRMVKSAMREWSRGCICPPRQLRCTCSGTAAGVLVTRKAVKASALEVQRNPRARSARIRAWRKAA